MSYRSNKLGADVKHAPDTARLVIALALSGRTYADAAAVLGVSIRTLYRWVSVLEMRTEVVSETESK